MYGPLTQKKAVLFLLWQLELSTCLKAASRIGSKLQSRVPVNLLPVGSRRAIIAAIPGIVVLDSTEEPFQEHSAIVLN